jgi:hypothetical protein
MTRRALSVTLESDNVTWLKGRAGVSGDSVSEVLDQIVSQARRGGRVEPARSVAGTIDIDPSDPMLKDADAAVRSLLDASIARPFMVRETRTRYRAGRAPRTAAPKKKRG